MIYKVNNNMVPEGTHVGKLIQVTEIQTKNGPAAKFIFLLEGFQQIVGGICNAVSLAPGTKLYQWLSVLNGANIDVGEEVDTEKMIGSIVELSTADVKKNGQIYVNVTEIKRLVALPDNSEVRNTQKSVGGKSDGIDYDD